MVCQVVGCNEYTHAPLVYDDASGLTIEVFLCRRHERELIAPPVPLVAVSSAVFARGADAATIVRKAAEEEFGCES